MDSRLCGNDNQNHAGPPASPPRGFRRGSLLSKQKSRQRKGDGFILQTPYRRRNGRSSDKRGSVDNSPGVLDSSRKLQARWVNASTCEDRGDPKKRHTLGDVDPCPEPAPASFWRGARRGDRIEPVPEGFSRGQAATGIRGKRPGVSQRKRADIARSKGKNTRINNCTYYIAYPHVIHYIDGSVRLGGHREPPAPALQVERVTGLSRVIAPKLSTMARANAQPHEAFQMIVSPSQPCSHFMNMIRSRLQTPDSRLQTPDSRLQTPDSRPRQEAGRE